MAAAWFALIMGEEKGPLSARELLSMARSGDLRIDDWVRKGTDGNWVRSENVLGLFDLPSLPVVVDKSVAVIADLPTASQNDAGLGDSSRTTVNDSTDIRATWIYGQSHPETMLTTERELPSYNGQRPRGVVVPLRTMTQRQKSVEAKQVARTVSIRQSVVPSQSAAFTQTVT